MQHCRSTILQFKKDRTEKKEKKKYPMGAEQITRFFFQNPTSPHLSLLPAFFDRTARTISVSCTRAHLIVSETPDTREGKPQGGRDWFSQNLSNSQPKAGTDCL